MWLAICRSVFVLPIALLAAALAPTLAQGGQASAQVLFQGKQHVASALPEHFPRLAAEAVAIWAPWAGENSFRIEVAADGKALLLVHGKRSATTLEWSKLETLTALAGKRLPYTPGPATPSPASAPTAPAPDEEEDLEPWDDDPAEKAKGRAPNGPVEMPRFDLRAAVFIECRDERDLEKLMPYLERKNPQLSSWIKESAGQLTGFALQDPLVAAWLVTGEGLEEYNPLNEFVHRAMELDVLNRFGQQPYWLRHGLAWFAELEVCGSVYCFPYRDEFVGVGEHGGWKPQFQALAEAADDGFVMANIAMLRRGKYSDNAAAMAWGTAKHLLEAHGQALANAMLELDQVWRKEGIQTDASTGKWRTIEGYEVPPERQQTILEAQLGKDFLANLRKAALAKSKKKS